MNQEFTQEVTNANHTISEIRAGKRVSHRDIADAYAYLLVSNMVNVLIEDELITTWKVLHEL